MIGKIVNTSEGWAVEVGWNCDFDKLIHYDIYRITALNADSFYLQSGKSVRIENGIGWGMGFAVGIEQYPDKQLSYTRKHDKTRKNRD